MLVRLFSVGFALAAASAAWSITSVAQAGHGQSYGHLHGLHQGQVTQCREYEYGNPDLFYNFYAPPVCGGTGAELYLSPLPVPARVGHTYSTYQPLMPHEFLYQHQRSYHRYYNEGRGLTRTKVRWW